MSQLCVAASPKREAGRREKLEGRKLMSALQSNTDVLLVAIPMVGMLVIGFFRLDEAICKPEKRIVKGHPLSGWDAGGQPMCIEPDGKVLASADEDAIRSSSRLSARKRLGSSNSGWKAEV